MGAAEITLEHKALLPAPQFKRLLLLSPLYKTMDDGRHIFEARSPDCRDILARNGSAMDAAIAALFCNGVVNCQSMGLGGGFLMTIYQRDTKEAFTLNAREAAPTGATEDLYNDNPKRAKEGII